MNLKLFLIMILVSGCDLSSHYSPKVDHPPFPFPTPEKEPEKPCDRGDQCESSLCGYTGKKTPQDLCLKRCTRPWHCPKTQTCMPWEDAAYCFDKCEYTYFDCRYWDGWMCEDASNTDDKVCTPRRPS